MNKKLIKIAHVVAISAIALGAAIAGQGNFAVSGQNSNRTGQQQNGNANRQGNMNDNMNRRANDNSNAGDRTNSNSGQNANAGNANAGNMNRGAGGNTNSSGGMTGGNRNSNAGAGGQAGAPGRGAALGSNDRKFVAEAAMGGMMEVELGRLAVERGTSDAVKQFGQRMIDDHTRANQELMQVASAAGLTPPAALNAKHRATVARMARLSGAAFDREYARQMVKDHEKTVALFQREASRGTHGALMSFASAQLPALQEHLSMARALAGGGTTHTPGTPGAAPGGAPRH